MYWHEVASDTAGKVFKRISFDNGRTWSPGSLIFEPIRGERGVSRWGENAFLFDEQEDAVIFFLNNHLYPKNTFTGEVERFTRIFYMISFDEAESFSETVQLIQEGCNSDTWARGITFGKNNAAISFCAPIKTRSTNIILPVQICPADSDFDNPFLIKWQAACFIGRWEGKRIRWDLSKPVSIYPKLSSRGLCEPAIAELMDDSFLMVCRGSNHTIPNLPGYKWFCTSKDGGYEWSNVRPFCYDDGERFYSPATGSRLIRHSKNRKLYWIGNIVPENPDGNRPRYPLQIAEVNEARVGLTKNTVGVIEDKRQGDSPLVQFSNFRVYEDRETGEFVLTMARIQERGNELTSPAYEYRIQIL